MFMATNETVRFNVYEYLTKQGYSVPESAKGETATWLPTEWVERAEYDYYIEYRGEWYDCHDLFEVIMELFK